MSRGYGCPMARVPLSILDLAPVPEGTTSAAALQASEALAVRADELGFHRYWVAEHHNLAWVASTEPAVLMAHLAARTSQIRLGSGGVMLPNHTPLVVAEQYALLEALHPGRIDLGIGRAPGTDRHTAVALRRQTDGSEDEEFPRHLLELMALLGDDRTGADVASHLRATPQAMTSPSIFLLGSSPFSAQLAGLLGLPYAFAHHFDMGGTGRAADIYREHFRPSPVLDEPHLLVTAVAVAAASAEHAEYLLGPHRLVKYGMRTGRMFGLLPTEQAHAHPAMADAATMDINFVAGPGEVVAEGLEKLVAEFDAAEVMITVSALDIADRIDSIERLAAAWS